MIFGDDFGDFSPEFFVFVFFAVIFEGLVLLALKNMEQKSESPEPHDVWELLEYKSVTSSLDHYWEQNIRGH